MLLTPRSGYVPFATKCRWGSRAIEVFVSRRMFTVACQVLATNLNGLSRPMLCIVFGEVFVESLGRPVGLRGHCVTWRVEVFRSGYGGESWQRRLSTSFVSRFALR